MGHGLAKNLLENGHALTILGHNNRQPVEVKWMCTKGELESFPAPRFMEVFP